MRFSPARPWRQRLYTVLCLLLLVPGVIAVAHTPSNKVRYGRRVRFVLGQELVSPDFTLRYTGKTHEKSPVFPPGFDFENFVVEAGGHAQTVGWSGGTGLIGPSGFRVGDKSFRLEMYYSERLKKWLARDELVVSPAP